MPQHYYSSAIHSTSVSIPKCSGSLELKCKDNRWWRGGGGGLSQLLIKTETHLSGLIIKMLLGSFVIQQNVRSAY